MQIVMELAGYTMGRSDLVRRAMSKKKGDVMQRERQNFVYGNPEENVPGCINRGIDEKTANKIFDEMIDFAKYAFNKSHAAAYAMVSYQTAYLKCHYPKEYMAALITSVMDRTTKVSEYIAHCKQLGIEILPPDINEGYGKFSVTDKGIRFGLSALHSVGDAVINSIVEEREAKGPFKDLKDLVNRLSNKEVNKRTLESFIKSGALDCFPTNRRQMMMMYTEVLDIVNREKKNAMSGQMSLLDMLGEEDKKAFDIAFPKVSEYEKEEKLAYEKEVLGIYATGHPLENYQSMLQKNIDATTSDFVIDPETESAGVMDQLYYTLGGMVAAKTVKMTKSNQNMAFITLEDTVGTLEIVVFPKAYEKYRQYMEVDSKIFVYGRANISEKESKLILDKLVPFSEVPKQVYVQFQNKEEYQSQEQKLYDLIDNYAGDDRVTVVLKEEKMMKPLNGQFQIDASGDGLIALEEMFGKEHVAVKDGKLNMR